MKKTLFTSIFLSFILCLNARVDPVPSPGKEGDKDVKRKALIIANGDYEEGTRWSNISSLKDVPILVDALVKKGFDTLDITVVTNADHIQMDNAFKDFTKELPKDAVVFFHYSGHGQQVFDDADDEVDGYDEAIIPVNAPARFMKGRYEGEYHIRDEKLGEYLDEIRRAIGPDGNVLAVLDACHSGTGTRGFTKHRGTTRPLEPENYKPKKTEVDNKYGLVEEDDRLAPITCFYGASPDQLNYEYELAPDEYVGSLSYAVSKALTDAGPQTTYRGLFDEVKLTMSVVAPSQTPMSEGLTDQQIFGGNIMEQVEYYSVLSVTQDQGKIYLTLNGGQLSGIHEGAKFSIYPINTYNRSEVTPLASGTIFYSEMLVSDLEITDKVDAKKFEGAWAMIDEINYGDMAVNVRIDLRDKNLSESITRKMGEYDLMRVTEESSDLIIENVPTEDGQSRGVVKDQIQVYSKNDIALWSHVISDAQVDQLSDEVVQVIMDYTQKRFLRKLESTDRSLQTSLELIPVHGAKKGARFIVDSLSTIDSKLDDNGNVAFNEGDFFRIRVKNKGTKTLYFTLLDIQPDNEINVLIPGEGEIAADFALPPRGEFESKEFVFGPPFGTEVFKLIATEEPLDLRSIIKTRGASTRGPDSPKSPLDLLFSDSYKSDDTATRGGSTPNVPSGAANIESFVFQIEP